MTSVQVFRQATRTLGTASDAVRTITATTTKPSAQTAGSVTTVSLSQVAAVESGIPNVYLESQGMASIVESDLRLTVNGGLDKLVTDGLNTSGTVSKGTFDVLNAVRRGITAVTAGGYTPDVLVIDAAVAESLDLFRDGASPGQYVFGAGRFAPGEVFGLNVRVTSAAGTAVVDTSAYGRLFVSPISLARFEESAGADQHLDRSPRGSRRLWHREDRGGRAGNAVMAAKKVKLQVSRMRSSTKATRIQMAPCSPSARRRRKSC